MAGRGAAECLVLADRALLQRAARRTKRAGRTGRQGGAVLHRHGRGFTLLELLVVIAIIAVLVALLFPTARGVYVAAMEFQCQNRIGQLA